MDRSLAYGGLGTSVGLYVSTALTRASYRGVRRLIRQGMRQWYPTVQIPRIQLAKQQLDLALFANDDDTGTLLLTCTGVFYVTNPGLEVYEFCRAPPSGTGEGDVCVLPQVALLVHTCMYDVLHQKSFQYLHKRFQGKVAEWALHMLCNDAARVTPPSQNMVKVYRELFAPFLGPSLTQAAAAPTNNHTSWFGWPASTSITTKPQTTTVPHSPAQLLDPITAVNLDSLCGMVHNCLYDPKMRFLCSDDEMPTAAAAVDAEHVLGVTMQATPLLCVVLIPSLVKPTRAFETHNALEFLNGFAVHIGRLGYLRIQPRRA